MSFGENMQKLRRESGMSQEELAEKVVVTRQTISKWELDQSTPDLEYILQLSEIFGVSTDFLIKGTAPAPEPVSVDAASFDMQPCNSKSYGIKSVIGIIISIVSSIPIIILFICSVQVPHTHIMDVRGTYTGLTGWLFGYNEWYTFTLCCTGLLAGIALLADDLIFRNLKTGSKKSRILIYPIIIGLLLLLLNFAMVGFVFVPGITDIALVIFIIAAIVAAIKYAFVFVRQEKSRNKS